MKNMVSGRSLGIASSNLVAAKFFHFCQRALEQTFLSSEDEERCRTLSYSQEYLPESSDAMQCQLGAEFALLVFRLKVPHLLHTSTQRGSHAEPELWIQWAYRQPIRQS
jgi:hypothetical protein